MFEAWGRGLYRARRLTVVVAVLFAVAAGVWGTGVFSKLNSGDTFTPPNSQSNQESNLAASVFGRHDADVVVLYHSSAMTVGDPAFRQATSGTRQRTGLAVSRAWSPPTSTPLTRRCSSPVLATRHGRTPIRPLRTTSPAASRPARS